MAKLKGKKKAAFLARMKKGRLAKAAKTATKNISKIRSRKPKSVNKRRKSQSTNTRKRTNKTVAKKRSSSKKSKFAIPSIVKKAAAGIGLATIATVIVGQFAPQAAPIVRPIAAFAGGGVVGVISDIFLSGGSGILSNLLGGFTGQTGVDNGMRQSV